MSIEEIFGPERATVYASLIQTTVAIIHRHINLKNKVLSQRKASADRLHANCRDWAKLLIDMIDVVSEKWDRGDPEAAREAVVALIEDHLAINYYTLDVNRSTTLSFLGKDGRFADFAIKCSSFYKSALDLKRIIHGEIRGVTSDAGVKVMADLWKEELYLKLEGVNIGHDAILSIVPK